MTIFYIIFAGISSMIFTVINGLFVLIDDIARYNFFSAETINDFTSKIYVIIGVLMLFKLVISAVQYIVNPDMFDDKNKGLGAVLKKSIIVVILLAIVPSIFQLAMEIQGDIIDQIPKVIFGNKSYNTGSAGKDISSTVVRSFIVPKDGYEEISVEVKDEEDIRSVITDGCSTNFLSKDFWGGNGCKYNLWWILLIPVVGVFLIYILVSLVIDVATRTIKLAIVQILAPIPITAYITDEKKLTNWATTSVQIYVDLFIRLAVIFLIVYIMQVVLKDMFVSSGYDNFTNSISSATGRRPEGIEIVLVKMVIVIALLLFAKNAPKFITDLLGLKGAGEGFNDMFKRAGGLFGATTAGLTGGLANYQNRMRNAKSDRAKWDGLSFGQKMKARAGALGSAGAGMTSATFRGGRASLNGKGLKEAFNTGHKGAVTARQNREMDNMNNVSSWDRVKTRYQDFMGLDTNESLAENRQKAYSTLHQDVGNFKKAAMGRYVKTANVAMVEGGANKASTQLGQLLVQNKDAIIASGNIDLQNYLNRFEWKVDATGKVDLSSVKLKNGIHIGYHDLAAISTDATQAGIGSIAGLTAENGALTLAAQKDLFTATMAGEVRDTSGNKIDALNVGSGKTHTDIDTAFQQANLHLAENAVPLNGGDATELQKWFRGVSDRPDHVGQDFGNMDDIYQKKSADLSAEMATSREARARESNKRHDANKQQNSGKK